MLGKCRKILHKWAKGAVDLQIDGAAGEIAAITEANLALLEAEKTEVEETGRSASIRVNVPVVDRLTDFAAQEEPLRTGLQAAVRLLRISPQARLPQGDTCTG